MKKIMLATGLAGLAAGIWLGAACCTDSITRYRVPEGWYRYVGGDWRVGDQPPVQEYRSDPTCSVSVTSNEVTIEYDGTDHRRYRVRYAITDRFWDPYGDFNDLPGVRQFMSPFNREPESPGTADSDSSG
jgi:hypothetical protein